MEAAALRRALHPEPVVSYVIEQTLACTDEPGTRTPAMQQLLALGGTDVHLTGDAGSLRDLAFYTGLLESLRHRFPSVGLNGLSATLVLTLARQAGVPVDEALVRLRAAGLQSLGADDALLLDDTVRATLDPVACPSADWLRVHRAAHRMGLPSQAALVFGAGESDAQRARHLQLLAALQEETGGFVAFTPTAYSPKNPPPTHRALDEATAVDYLKTQAIARLMLDGIAHVQASSQSLKVLQMALRFGADDAGPVQLDEQTLRQAGTSNRATEEELRRIIRDAGFMPVQRDSLFRTMFLG
jgi:cyclic dehypoxanthinyl futalosine synthase